MADVEKVVLLKRIAEVEAKISEVTVQRKELEENAKNAKSEVHQSIGCQLERLRQREVQLTRQVDALIGHQGSLLQMQLAKLYQELGSLRASQSFGHQAEVLTSPDRELSPSMMVRHLQYSSPTEGELCSVIESFGRFEAALGSSRPSVHLLPDEEAYEDSNHHLMHKTLEDKMQWTFPKPPSKRDDWVQNIKIEDFEMSDCESIELLCPSETQDKDFWLLNNKSATSSSCSCEEKGTIEIENLANLNCASLGKWTKEELKYALPIPDVANTCLSSQSSKCSSFRDCTCPENCLLTHLREQTKRLWLEEPQKKQDCINNTLREAWKVDRNLWLHKTARKNDRSEWLLKRSSPKSEDSLGQPALSESCQSLKKQMKELFFESGNSDWLSSKRIKSNDGWISTSRC